MEFNRRRSFGVMGALALGASSLPKQAFGGIFGRRQKSQVCLPAQSVCYSSNPRPATCKISHTSFDDDPQTLNVLVGYDLLVNIWGPAPNALPWTVAFTEPTITVAGTMYSFTWTQQGNSLQIQNSSTNEYGFQVFMKLTGTAIPAGTTIGSNGLTITVTNSGGGHCSNSIPYYPTHYS